MANPSSESELLPSVWDRLRDRLEQIRTSLEQKGGTHARDKARAGRAGLLRRQVGAAEPATASLVVLAFSRGRRKYGIPLENVQEVQALEQFSPVPGAPACILGVVHWRGAILALLDLARLFEVAEPGLSDLHAYVVVECSGKRLAVAASKVDDVLSLSVNGLKAAPQLPPTIAPEWIIGVHDDNQLILKIDEIFNHLERGGKSSK